MRPMLMASRLLGDKKVIATSETIRKNVNCNEEDQMVSVLWSNCYGYRSWLVAIETKTTYHAPVWWGQVGGLRFGHVDVRFDGESWQDTAEWDLQATVRMEEQNRKHGHYDLQIRIQWLDQRVWIVFGRLFVELVRFLDRLVHLNRFLDRSVRDHVGFLLLLELFLFLRCGFVAGQRAARMLLGDRPEAVDDDKEHQHTGIENWDYDVGPVHLQVFSGEVGVRCVVVGQVARLFVGHVGDGRVVFGHLFAESFDLLSCFQQERICNKRRNECAKSECCWNARVGEPLESWKNPNLEVLSYNKVIIKTKKYLDGRVESAGRGDWRDRRVRKLKVLRRTKEQKNYPESCLLSPQVDSVDIADFWEEEWD